MLCELLPLYREQPVESNNLAEKQRKQGEGNPAKNLKVSYSKSASLEGIMVEALGSQISRFH
jgi:hypothetical protein